MTLQALGLRRILPSTLSSCSTCEGRNSFKFSTTHLTKLACTRTLSDGAVADLNSTAFYRHVLNHEDVSNSLIMIQPTLDAYRIDQDEAEAVLLDSTSIQPDAILLLDTFFHILIFNGETIAAWRKEGYQDNPEYANFAELLQKPKEDAKVYSCLPHSLDSHVLIENLNRISSKIAFRSRDSSSVTPEAHRHGSYLAS
jgi:hypothetical protein